MRSASLHPAFSISVLPVHSSSSLHFHPNYLLHACFLLSVPKHKLFPDFLRHRDSLLFWPVLFACLWASRTTKPKCRVWHAKLSFAPQWMGSSCSPSNRKKSRHPTARHNTSSGSNTEKPRCLLNRETTLPIFPSRIPLLRRLVSLVCLSDWIEFFRTEESD